MNSNLTVQFINTTIATVSDTPAKAMDLGPLASTMIGLIPWIAIFLLLYKDSIPFGMANAMKYMKMLRKRTGMGIIVFATTIDDKSMLKFEAQLDKAVEKGITEIILILDTFGGMVFAAERMANAIKYFPGKVHAYIPRYAMSGGSFVAWACNDIHMVDKSSMGPIDPQMGILFWVNSAKAWQTIVKQKGAKAEDNSIAMAVYGEQYTRMIKEKLSSFELLKDKDAFVDTITNGDIPHGFQIDKRALQKFGFDIKTIEFPEVFEIIKKNPKGVRGYF